MKQYAQSVSFISLVKLYSVHYYYITISLSHLTEKYLLWSLHGCLLIVRIRPQDEELMSRKVCSNNVGK